MTKIKHIDSLEFIKGLIEIAPSFIEKVNIFEDQIIIETNKDSVFALIFLMNKHVHYQFKLMMDITATDYPSESQRFSVSYQLLSILYNQRITILVKIDSNTPLPSLVSLYKSANWMERELWDLYGIFFSEHPDLRRILTDYGFQGFPMRKDFPLSGFLEVVYAEEAKKVIYVPLELTQEYRYFDFVSSWQ